MLVILFYCMRWLPVVLCVVWCGAAQDIPQLGVLTPFSAIRLVKNTDRKDWHHFTLELFPETPPTNKVTLNITNEFLVLSNLVALPSGRVLIGMRSVCLNGMESATSSFYLEIQRAEPPAPTAYMVAISGQRITNNLEKIMRERRTRKVYAPPVPGQTNVVEVPLDLPKGTNVTYAEGLDKMAHDYHKREHRRRND